MDRDAFKVVQEVQKLDHLIVEMKIGGYSIRRSGDFIRDKRGSRRVWGSLKACKKALETGNV